MKRTMLLAEVSPLILERLRFRRICCGLAVSSSRPAQSLSGKDANLNEIIAFWLRLAPRGAEEHDHCQRRITTCKKAPAAGTVHLNHE
eukprot:2325371-Amphidinium_carterae.1